MDALSGLVGGLGLAVVILVVGVLVSDRVRNRAQVAAALGAPVELSLLHCASRRADATQEAPSQARDPPHAGAGHDRATVEGHISSPPGCRPWRSWRSRRQSPAHWRSPCSPSRSRPKGRRVVMADMANGRPVASLLGCDGRREDSSTPSPSRSIPVLMVGAGRPGRDGSRVEAEGSRRRCWSSRASTPRSARSTWRPGRAGGRDRQPEKGELAGASPRPASCCATPGCRSGPPSSSAPTPRTTTPPAWPAPSPQRRRAARQRRASGHAAVIIPIRSPSGGRRPPTEDKSLRRVWVVWALLFFNVLSYAKMATVMPIPHKIGQVFTQGALAGRLRPGPDHQPEGEGPTQPVPLSSTACSPSCRWP